MNAPDAAIALALTGIPTFPCHVSKAPACPEGFKAATSDPANLAVLWRRFPGTLVGIPTGERSGLAVLDIDAKHREARDWWAANRVRLPRTRTVRTRSGGLHLWFRHVSGLGCRVAFACPGVDVRAEGGYVIAWEAAGFPVLQEAPYAPWPAWVTQPTPARHQRSAVAPRVPDDEQTRRLLRFVRNAPEGQRNSRLFWASCRMAAALRSDLMTEADAEELLLKAGLDAGLPAREARATVASGLATGTS